MNRTPLLTAVLVLAANAADAQTFASASSSGTFFPATPIRFDVRPADLAAGMPAAAAPGRRGAARSENSTLPVSADRTREGTRSWDLGADLVTPPQAKTALLTLTAEAKYWEQSFKPRSVRKWNIDWLGLLTQQTRIDATMHWLRLRQPKFHTPLYHSRYFEGYREALKGYYSLPLRWNDGDDFLTNDIGHPIMGAVFSYTFTDYDRRCSNLVFGVGNYWSCMGRAAIYASLASANWEWNPVMSESALGHIGKFYTCERGRCEGEGGWTDLVMTPLGGMGIRIAGDLARARLWPMLDRHLSGNALAKALSYTLKSLTAPSHFLNCAFKLDFDRAWTSATVKAPAL